MLKIILAANVQEGNAYAREQGFRQGDFRVAFRAATIRGVRESEVHELPSFQRRLDKHAIESELRYNRGPRFVIEDGWNWPALPEEPDEPELPFDTSITKSGVGHVGDPVTQEEETAKIVADARTGTRHTRKAATRPRKVVARPVAERFE